MHTKGDVARFLRFDFLLFANVTGWQSCMGFIIGRVGSPHLGALLGIIA